MKDQHWHFEEASSLHHTLAQEQRRMMAVGASSFKGFQILQCLVKESKSGKRFSLFRFSQFTNDLCLMPSSSAASQESDILLSQLVQSREEAQSSPAVSRSIFTWPQAQKALCAKQEAEVGIFKDISRYRDVAPINDPKNNYD